MKISKIVIVLIGVLFFSMGIMGSCNEVFASTGTKDEYTDSDLRYLTSIIYCEARGEGYAGQKAVGIVVMNRVGSELFPDDIESVIYQRGQFAPVGNGSLSSALWLYDSQKTSGQYDETMLSCMQAAQSVLEGSRMINVEDQAYYFGQYLFFSRYVKNASFRLGNHMFR